MTQLTKIRRKQSRLNEYKVVIHSFMAPLKIKQQKRLILVCVLLNLWLLNCKDPYKDTIIVPRAFSSTT